MFASCSSPKQKDLSDCAGAWGLQNVRMADKKCKPSGTCRPLPAHSEALVGTAELDLVLKAFSKKKASALSWELFGHCTS